MPRRNLKYITKLKKKTGERSWRLRRCRRRRRSRSQRPSRTWKRTRLVDFHGSVGAVGLAPTWLVASFVLLPLLLLLLLVLLLVLLLQSLPAWQAQKCVVRAQTQPRRRRAVCKKKRKEKKRNEKRTKWKENMLHLTGRAVLQLGLVRGTKH